MKKHTVRIVGGEYRRTSISVLDLEGLRPTPDRVKETLFNWISHIWQQKYNNRKVLDLFAGTGSLGFEAASRGVTHVQMIETNPQAVKALRATRNKLNATSVRIHHGDAIQALSGFSDSKFDLIFIDPPFNSYALEPLWEPLKNILMPEGLVYVESGKPIILPLWLTELRTSKAGQVHFCLAQFDA